MIFDCIGQFHPTEIDSNSRLDFKNLSHYSIQVDFSEGLGNRDLTWYACSTRDASNGELRTRQMRKQRETSVH